MSDTLEYEVQEILSSSANFTCYKAINNKNKKVVCVKTPTNAHTSNNLLFHLKNEFNISNNISVNGARKAHEYTSFNNKPALILEYISGQTLHEIDYSKLSFLVIIKIVINLCKILDSLHDKGIIHMDVNPSNIICDDKKIVTLIDFGISSDITIESRHFHNIGITQGSLLYISPEQTGRMNRMVDKRTDFYSLGVVLYELLTKILPFNSDDQMELIHLHIAQLPVAPHIVDNKIPIPLSNITLKLLAKNAEDRYQSIKGLIYDLEKCEDQIKKGVSNNFEIGSNDYSPSLEIPQKLYGRDNELMKLNAAFEAVLYNAETKLCLVEGIAGIGKSLLINELNKVVTRANGIFISGKFDQLKQNLPYFAFVQAFSEQIYSILTEPDEILAKWKTNFLKNIGNNGRLIIDLIPDIELIIGPQPKLDELPTIQAQNRFKETLLNFVSTFSSWESPVVIFIDDLQWADAASLNFINQLLSNNIINLLIVGAYRNNEIDESHYLSVSVNKIIESGHEISKIKLNTLGTDAISELLSDTLMLSTSECEPLTKIIKKKTGGNPFFVKQLLTKLYESDHFRFDQALHRWTFDLEQITQADISDNIIDIIVDRIKKLEDKDQEILKLASCVGNRFSLRTLTFISDRSISDIVISLWVALKEGLIRPTGKNINPLIAGELDFINQNLNNEYCFVHDRIHQSIYSIIESTKKIETHLKIGQLLLHSIAENELDNDLYSVLDQCNKGKSLISNTSEIKRLIELNLLAGTKAKEANAYKSALSYLSTSLEFLNKNSWETDYETCFELFINTGECAYLSGNLLMANNIFKEVVEKAKTNYDKAKVCSIQIGLYSNLGDLKTAKEVGLKGLKLLDFSIPDKGSRLKVIIELLKLKFRIRNNKYNDLLNRSTLNEKEPELALFMLIELQAALFSESPELLAISILKALEITLKHGNGYMSYNAYSGYGAILALGLGKYKEGWELTKVGYELTKLSGSDFYLSRGSYAMGITVINWNMHTKHAIPYLEKGYQLGIQSGDFTNTAQLSMSLLTSIYLLGTPLENVLFKAVQYLEFVTKINYGDIITFHNLFIHALRQLIGNESDVIIKTSSESYLNERLNESAFVTSRMIYKTLKIQKLCLFGEYKFARDYIEDADHEFEALKVSSISADYLLYKVIAYSELYNSVSFIAKQKYQLKIKNVLKTLKNWAKSAPENFQHKYDICRAEFSKINGNVFKTINYYKKAIDGAKKNGFIQYEAFFHERIGVFYIKLLDNEYANYHLSAALNGYLLWGAQRKVTQLKENYSEFLSTVPLSNISSGKRSSTTTLHGSSTLDFKSLIKASQTISSEIVLDKLLSTLMKIVIENAGAEEGFLITKKDSSFLIQAKGAIDVKNVKTLQNEDINSSKEIPRTIIQYVNRTKKSVVIHDAQNDSKFSNDPVIKLKTSKSILCSPIINQNEVLGILYLENKLVTNTFDNQRIEILDMLSGQIAVTLRNALLFDSLEQKVSERTEEIDKQKEELKRTNLELININQEKNDLISVVSHDLRSPLNQVKGLARLISITDSSNIKERDDYLNRIVESIDRLNSMITKILDINAIESQELNLSIEQIDIVELIENQINYFSVLAQEKEIKISTEIDHNSLFLNLDKNYFIQVINNLISNAIKFSNKKDQVSINVTQNDRVLIEIKDTGPGISGSDQKKLFNKFQKLTAQPTGGEISTGLGLSIVKKYVDAMNGKIWCESELNIGTSFFIEFKRTQS